MCMRKNVEEVMVVSPSPPMPGCYVKEEKQTKPDFSEYKAAHTLLTYLEDVHTLENSWFFQSQFFCYTLVKKIKNQAFDVFFY